jgi:hypothetical protein
MPQIDVGEPIKGRRPWERYLHLRGIRDDLVHVKDRGVDPDRAVRTAYDTEDTNDSFSKDWPPKSDRPLLVRRTLADGLLRRALPSACRARKSVSCPRCSWRTQSRALVNGTRPLARLTRRCCLTPTPVISNWRPRRTKDSGATSLARTPMIASARTAAWRGVCAGVARRRSGSAGIARSRCPYGVRI